MLLGAFTITVSAQKKVDPTGTWSYKAPAAPYEYSSGEILVEKDGKDFSVKMLLGQYEMPAEKVVYEDNVLSFDIYIEMETVEIKMTAEKESMEGTASYSEGTIPITATKKE